MTVVSPYEAKSRRIAELNLRELSDAITRTAFVAPRRHETMRPPRI